MKSGISKRCSTRTRRAAAERASADAGRVDGAVLPGPAGRGAARDAAADGRGAAHGVLPHHGSGPGCAGADGGGRGSSSLRDKSRERIMGPRDSREPADRDPGDGARRVLERLAGGEAVKVSTLRTATAAALQELAALLRKKWIARETVGGGARCAPDGAIRCADSRDALAEADRESAGDSGGTGGVRRANCRWLSCGAAHFPSSTLQTLVRRGLVRIEERPAAFRLGGLAGKPDAHPAERVADRCAGFG